MCEEYCVRATHFGYEVLKWDGDHSMLTIHEIEVYRHRESCSCPAGRLEWCRHRDIADVAYVNGYIGNGWVYDYCNKEWKQYSWDSG